MEDIFNVRYNTELDRLEFKKKKNNNSFFKFVAKHKIFSLACMSFLALSMLNFYLIFNFMKLLQNI